MGGRATRDRSRDPAAESSALVPYHAAERVVDALHQVIGQRDVGGTDVLVHLPRPRGAGDGRADVGLAQYPRQRQRFTGSPLRWFRTVGRSATGPGLARL